MNKCDDVQYAHTSVYRVASSHFCLCFAFVCVQASTVSNTETNIQLKRLEHTCIEYANRCASRSAFFIQFFVKLSLYQLSVGCHSTAGSTLASKVRIQASHTFCRKRRISIYHERKFHYDIFCTLTRNGRE